MKNLRLAMGMALTLFVSRAVLTELSNRDKRARQRHPKVNVPIDRWEDEGGQVPSVLYHHRRRAS